MALTPNLESANNAGFLWPPIADAVDTFVRRRHNRADAYERVWRLIHVWEAIEITLSVAAIARVLQSSPNGELLRRQREFFYGKSWDPVTLSFKSMQGAADGGIDQWINILDEIAKSSELDGRFLPVLREFLLTEQIEMTGLLIAWAKACDVPPDFRRYGLVDVRTAMRYVNSFRNRLAHVPFPHDPLAEVGEALEAATEGLFSVPPVPSSHERGGRSNPLTGALRHGRCFLHGSHHELLQQGSDGDVEFVFPCVKRDDISERWSARAFVHVDSMTRPHILTRIKGLDICEYTRFRAEANAVIVLPETGIPQRLPEPSKIEYQAEDEEQESGPPATPQRETTMAEAFEAIRSNDYDSAIAFFERLTHQRPYYHVAWLRLGHAKREKAVRLAEDQRESAVNLLRLAVDDLERATRHVARQWQAVAHYERSKAFYHLARLDTTDQENQRLCREEAKEALALSNEKKYQTWWEHLQVWAPWTTEESSSESARTEEVNLS